MNLLSIFKIVKFTHFEAVYQKKVCDIPKKSSESIRELQGHIHPFFIFTSAFWPENNSFWFLSLLTCVNKSFFMVLKINQHGSGYFLIHLFAKLSFFAFLSSFIRVQKYFWCKEMFQLKHLDDSMKFYKDWSLFRSVAAKKIRIDFIILRLLLCFFIFLNKKICLVQRLLDMCK